MPYQSNYNFVSQTNVLEYKGTNLVEAVLCKGSRHLLHFNIRRIERLLVGRANTPVQHTVSQYRHN